MFGGSAFPAFGQPATFGQNTNSVNGISFAPETIGTAATGTTFGTSVGATMSAGNSTAFGKDENSNPFGTASIFGQRSNADNGNPFAQESFGTSTPFSTSTGASVFSGNSSGVFGPNAGFGSKTFTPSVSSFSAFGTTSASSSGAFGHSSATGASNSFGSTVSAFSSTPASFASGNATGVSGTPTFGTSSSFNFVASKTNNHESFNSRSIFGQPVSASHRHSVFGITAGPQTTPTIGSIKSGPSAISSRGSRVALNVATRANGSPGVAAGKVASISTMPIDQDKNYEELRFEHYQLSHNKALTSTPPVGPAIVTLHSKPQTSTAASTGPGIWSIIPSTTPSLSTLQCQPQTSSTTSTQLGPWGNFPSSLSTFTFQSQPQASSATLTGTGTWANSSSSKLSPFIFHSQPQASSASATSTGTEAWGKFPSSTQSIFTFQCQPQPSSAPSTGTRQGDSFPSSTQSTFTFQSLPQTSSATSTGTGPWANFSSSAQSTFTFQSLPQISSAMSTGTGPWRQFPSSKAPLFTSHSQTQTSSAVPTGPGAWGMFPSNTTSPSQTTTPTAFIWTKPEHIAAPQKTQTAPAAHAITNKILEQPSKEALKSETDNLSTGMQQSCQSTITTKPSAVASPFGVQSTFQTSVDSPISSTMVQRGISRIPVADNPAPVKRFSMLTARNLTVGRSKLSFEKYKPTNDGQKVSFYEEKLPGICRVAASIIPRQNPRAWVLNPMEEGVLEAKSSNSSLLEEKSSEFETGKDGSGSSAKCKLNGKVPFDSTSTQDEKFHVIQRNQTDKVATRDNYAAGVEAMMPKMQSLDYYINPPVQELAAKERVEPGFCCHVKDFVVGRKGYGSIKFLGETDVRNLDLESLIKFNCREVIIYSDESKKPRVGQGLNKPAEVTLLNVKCIDKDTGKQYLDGPKVDKWRKLLIKKAAEQGVEFVSYDPVTGEWKFRVQHF